MTGKKKVTFWKLEFKEDNHWRLQHLSSTAFALAGFSFTALSVFIGFFRENLGSASGIISVLFICTALYVLAAEMAREAYQVPKFLLAETTYMFTSALLTSSFLLFVVQQTSIIINPLAYLAMLLAVGYLGWRAIHNIYVAVRASKPPKDWKDGQQTMMSESPAPTPKSLESPSSETSLSNNHVVKLIELVDTDFDNPSNSMRFDIAFRARGPLLIGLGFIIGATYALLSNLGPGTPPDIRLLSYTFVVATDALAFSLFFAAESPKRLRQIRGGVHFDKLRKTGVDFLFLGALVRMRASLPKGATLKAAYDGNKSAFTNENLVRHALEPLQ